MNFDRIPDLRWQYGCAFSLGLMATTNIEMLAYFKRKQWF